MQHTESASDNVVHESENIQKRARVHGNIQWASKQYGIDDRAMIDFSSNVNPLGPPAAALRAARKSLSSIDRYPDPEATGLGKEIARYFGIKKEQVLCGAGSHNLIHLIPRVFKPKKVLIPVPTFPEYAAAAAVAGAEAVFFPLKERDEFRLDPLEMAFALKGMDMAFLCNPNNPTGLAIQKSELLEIAKYSVENGVRLVVDEAFMDFLESESIVKEAAQSSNLICLRSFTTFFAMPGLRVGYLISDESTIGALRSGREPWTVNIVAEQAAIAALNDWYHIKKTRRLIEKERAAFLEALRFIPGVEPFPGAANFIFIKVTSEDGPLLVEKLAQRGFLIRDCSLFPGLDNRFIRISVRKGRENRALIKALRDALG